MIQKITIRNFKKLGEITFELSNPLVLLGPNNSGKTSLLQAITLWEAGIRKLAAHFHEKSANKKRLGITINRKDLLNIPTPSAKLLWNKKIVRSFIRDNEKNKTFNVNIEIIVEGFSDGKSWTSALEFDYANEEVIYCRPLRKDPDGKNRYEIDTNAFHCKVAYLQPMSGLASLEDRLTTGSIDRKIGEGKTADVIRNICYHLINPEKDYNLSYEKKQNSWQEIKNIIKSKFGITIHEPVFNPDNGLITMTYEENGIIYDLSNAGRGFQQTLLLLGFLYSNPNRIILMDEPDAHLEILRQKEIYNLIYDISYKINSQLIIASHSEVVLNEAARSKHSIIALIEEKAIPLAPTQRDKAQKMLSEVGWEKYYLARTKGHCIFLEGSSDAKNLIAFAKRLNHPVKNYLENAFIDFIEGNEMKKAFERFHALSFVIPELRGIALFDQLEKDIPENASLRIYQWKRREIENYFCFPEVFLRWAEAQETGLFQSSYVETMQKVIEDLFPPLYLKNRDDPWWLKERMSDYAEQVFKEFFKRQQLKITMRKSDFYRLIEFLKEDEILIEVMEKLDAIYEVIK